MKTMDKTIIGTGIFNLDIIVVREYPQWPDMRPFVEKEVLREVGGTCGNVMCMLASMGWKVRPVACLDDSAEGRKITEDLKQFGCDCSFVSNTAGGGTTLLRCTHKKDAAGNHVMSVRAGSPGGSRFPKRHFLRARDEAPEFLAALKDAPAVFFFDDPAAGNRALAKGLKERGALVYFEPSRVASNADLEAVGLSDIIKFSDENVPDVSFADAYPDKIFIQTMGPGGVRIKERGGDWYTIEGMKNDAVVDTEGAGDTFTSAFINDVAEGKTIADAAREALAMASRSIGFLGSKGMFRK
jgi:sugar/nucleoside kinase (ribokinase family)